MQGFKSSHKFLVVLITLIFSLLPGIAVSLGLGQIKLYSYLNEPLDAEIELMGAETFSPDQLVVSLASPEDFKKIDLARPYFLSKLRFQVIKQPDRTYIQVTSEEAVKQPYLEFLVVIQWPEGRLVRGYTLLLDPTPLGGVLKREQKPIPQKVTFSDERGVQKIRPKLSKNLFSINKSNRIASNEEVPIAETDEQVLDPAIQNFEPLFDIDPEFNAGSLAEQMPIEKTSPVSIETIETSEPSVSNSLSPFLYKNKLLLGSSLSLLFAIALTVWMLKRARESLWVPLKSIDPLKNKPFFDEEIMIKLDLADQYLAFEDHQGAREILEEIILRGNPQEIEYANKLLKKIPS